MGRPHLFCLFFEIESSYVAQAGLELTVYPRLISNPGSSASWALGSQVCTITPDLLG